MASVGGKEGVCGREQRQAASYQRRELGVTVSSLTAEYSAPPPPPYLLSLSSEPWLLCLMARLPGTAANQ